MWVWISSLLLAALASSQQAWAHAEHGMGEPVPQLTSSKLLPKGVSLEVVKTTAFQFSLATDGKQSVEVLSDEGEAFIQIQQAQVRANTNSAYWYRAQQPGGGAVPERLKDGEHYRKLPAAWTSIAGQAGFGWYDARLLDENLKRFTLKLRINNQTIALPIERKAVAAFQGYWSNQLQGADEQLGLHALIPGLTGGAIALRRSLDGPDTLEVLDTRARAFLRSTADGFWVDTSHPWFKKLGLFVDSQRPITRADWGSEWVKASNSSLLTYQDPRLQGQGKPAPAPQAWRIPVRLSGKAQQAHFSGNTVWVPKKPQ